MQFLRSFLPAEYGLSTGFVAYHHDRCVSGKSPKLKYVPEKDRILLSSQLDIIVYDALRFGPLIRLGSCDVFPLEAVYAYVEVKTSFNSVTDIRKCLRQSRKLRRMQTKFYRVPQKETYTKTHLAAGNDLMSIRSYVFVLGASDSLGDHSKFKTSMEAEAKATKGFLSGMYVQGKGYFQSHHCEAPGDPLEGTIEGEQPDRALLTFKLSLLSGLTRFPRIREHWTPALDTYYSPAEPQVFLGTAPLPGP